MALIGKIRQKTGLLLGFIGVSLLIFLVQEALSSNNSMGGTVKSLGKINGKKVDAAEYFDEVANYENRLKTLNPQFEMNESNSLAIREEVWNNIAFDNILGKTIKKLGLSVSAAELADAFKGKNISPLVMNVLGQSFVNPQTGMFDKAQMEYALNNMDQVDPMLRSLVIQLEPLVEQERTRAKYFSLVSKSSYVPSFIAKDMIDQQKVANADILAIPYSNVKDEEVKVTDEEIVNYVKKHATKYKREANVVLDLVTFDIKPSIEDQEELFNQLLQVKEELTSTDDDSLYIARNSIQGGGIYFFTADQIKQSGRINSDSIINASVGTFLGPVVQGEDIVLTYVADKKMIADSVRASRIVLAYQNAGDQATKNALAESIVADIKSGKASFAQKAAELSDDTESKMNGGDLGFIAQGTVEPELNQKLFFDMSVGDIEILESQAGVFIIQKTAQSPLKMGYRVVDFANELAASDATAKQIYNDANSFWTSSKTAADFDENTKTRRALKNLTITTKDISVAGVEGTRSIISWAFKDGKEGDVNFFDLSDKYAVVKLVKKNEAGLASLAEVKNEVTEILLAEKKAEVIKNKLGDTKSASFETLTQKISGNILLNKIVQYNSPYVEGVGVEPKLTGAIFGSKIGVQSNPIAGSTGVYVVKTNSIESLSGDVDIQAYKNQLIRQNISQISFDKLFGSILKGAKIEDQRYLVY